MLKAETSLGFGSKYWYLEGGFIKREGGEEEVNKRDGKERG